MTDHTIQESLISAIAGVTLPLGVMTSLIGAVMTIIWLYRWLTTEISIVSVFGGPVLILMGFGLMSMRNLLPRGEADEAEEAVDQPVVQPSPTKAPVEALPSSEPALDPIRLPRVENLESLWLIPILVLAAFIVYVLARKVVNDQRESRARRELSAALQARIDGKWGTFTARHQNLKRRFLEAETDWDMLFTLPALSDPSDPATSAMLATMRAADDEDSTLPPSVDDETTISLLPYPRAVTRFSVAWERAVANAKRVGQSSIPHEERRAISRIRALLAIAESPGSSEHERQSAYDQARKMIDKLTSVRVPPAAFDMIERRQQLMLERA